MQEDTPKQPSFEDIIRKAEHANLCRHIQICEQTKLEKKLNDGDWVHSGSINTHLVGDATHIDSIKTIVLQKPLQPLPRPVQTAEERPVRIYRQYDYDEYDYEEEDNAQDQENQMREEADNITKTLKCTFCLDVGQKLPAISLQKMGYDEHVQFSHKPGTVMILVCWMNEYWLERSTMQDIHQLCQANQEEWSGRVRLVGVNVSNRQNMAMNAVDTYKWTAFEHYYESPRNSTFRQLFHLLRSVHVCLFDKEGTASQILSSDQLSPAKISEGVKKLLTSNYTPTDEAITNNTSSMKLDQISWERINAAVNSLQLDESLQNVNFRLSCERKYMRGKHVFSADPLIISYSAGTSEQLEKYQEYVRKATVALKENEYVVRPYSQTQEIQMRLSFQMYEEAFRRNNLHVNSIVRNSKNISITESKWRQNRRLSVTQIPYQAEDAINRLALTGEEIREYDLQASRQIGSAIGRMPHFKVTGEKFLGISGLKEHRTGADQSILPMEGFLQFILSFSTRSSYQTYKLIQHLQQLVQTSNQVILHVILPQERFSHGLLESDDRIRKYYRPSNNQPDNFNVYLPQLESLLAVNRKGIISYAQESVNYPTFRYTVECTDGVIDGPKQINDKEFEAVLERLPLNKVFIDVQTRLKDLAYTPKLDISYSEDYLDLKMTTKKVYQPEVHVSVREEDWQVVQPLLDILAPHSIVIKEEIKTTMLPLGNQCVDCKTPLVLPYYYFFVSKVHRCCPCAERQDTTTPERLGRYPVMENSVLIIRDRKVDVRRLGLNIQPTFEYECMSNSFCCDGCGGGSNNEARYICMGCRREPNRRDYVDFCFECAQTIRGDDEQAKQRIVDRNQREHHTIRHSLLRVLYRPLDYYKF